MSDSPLLFTGFGTVTREVLGRLAERGRQVAAVGWGYDGWPYDRRRCSYDIYPSALAGAPPVLARVIAERRPEVVVALGDLWMIEWVSELDERRRTRFVPYFPVDGAPFYRPWARSLRDADVAVTCSEFGRGVVGEALPDLEVRLIPHGVDTAVFRPLEGHIRPPELEGRFIVGCTARNQPRKNLPVLISAFARFCADKPEALLYLHTDPTDVGWDILELLDRHGVKERTAISRFASVGSGLDPAALNEIYNLFDVMVLPTAGEGFGLPIVEAMAAGVPVVATAYSACVELVEGRGELVAVKEMITAGRHNVDYAVPDVEDMLEKLQVLYEQPERRKRHRCRGLELAAELDWSRIVPQWERLLDELTVTG